MSIYLDYNATAPLHPIALEAMAEIHTSPANPSSVHGFGRAAKARIEEARSVFAEYLNCFASEVLFVGSGTEANNQVLRAFTESHMLMVGASEHPSILSCGDKLGAAHIPVNQNGVTDLHALEQMLLGAKQPVIISIMLANNETGVVHPIKEIARIAKAHSALLHCDGVQGLSKIPIDFSSMGIDMMTLCAHKMGGPVGAGALIIRNDLPIKPLLIGGGQELRRRAGTENVAAIHGWASILSELPKDFMGSHFGNYTTLQHWFHTMESRIMGACPDAVILGHAVQRLPNTSCIIMPGIKAETQLMNFDLEGFAVSAGSACSSGRVNASHVLSAMGYREDEASCAIRISGGWNTSEFDIKTFTDAWIALYQRLCKKAA